MPKPFPGHEPDPMAGVVDRLLAQLPGLQGQPDSSRTAPRQVGQYATVSTVHDQAASPRQLLGVWGRVLLGLALGVMMAGWPYLRTCGFPLFGYLGAVVTVIMSGGWAAVASWRYRSALAHLVSLILVFYGMTLVVAELLPRTGYAVDQATWQCQETVSAFTSVTT